jgi:hypothetical protein
MIITSNNAVFLKFSAAANNYMSGRGTRVPLSNYNIFLNLKITLKEPGYRSRYSD